MRLRRITLRNFRNVGFATLELAGARQFLVGRNGQGKTNLLEAAGFVTALRSFRTNDHRLLIGHGKDCAALSFALEHEREGEVRVNLTLRSEGKEVWCEQTRVTKLAEYLGRFPTVVFSSQDLQLVRGSPVLRRRWLDLTLAAIDPVYLRSLQAATRALAERNALLKAGQGTDAELAAFESALAPAAADLIARRAAGLAELGRRTTEFYSKLSGEAEPAALEYEPNFAEPSADALRARLESGRERDRRFRSTLAGPHRDDLVFRVRGTEAKEFASEGQQRSLVLSLRLAQAAWFHERTGVRPVLLADDVLGELDPERRARFWAAVDADSQVIATGTHLPDAAGEAERRFGDWQVYTVTDGQFAGGGAAA